MASGVFVLKDAKTLIPMRSAEFSAEHVFQNLIADFPTLLAGDQIDPVSPRRWLLVKQEKSIPSEQGGGGRWSLDLLFVDQDGLPTFVEIKRQSDPRIRREVVAQMLDYAANAVAYWPVDELKSEFIAACERKSVSPEEELRERLGIDRDADAFWQQVKANVHDQRIRLLFVADNMPPELLRIIEFLNEQMDTVEVLGLELKQYEGEGLKTLVPVLYGRTQKSQQRKGVEQPSGIDWTENEIYEEIDHKFGASIAAAARQIGEWMQDNADSVWYGRGKKEGSMRAMFRSSAGDVTPFRLWTYGKFEIAFPAMLKTAFADEGLRRQLLERIVKIPGLNLGDDVINKYPSIPLKALSERTAMTSLLEALSWWAAELRRR